MTNAISVKERLKKKAIEDGKTMQDNLVTYGLERTIYRLSVSKYAEKFTLKGGIFLYALFDGEYARATMDIDLLAQRIPNNDEEMTNVFNDIFSIECDDALRFDLNTLEVINITEFKEYHGVNVSIMGYLDRTKVPVSIDIGFGDVVTPSPIDLDYPVLLEHLPSANILAYSLETVIAEKMHAIVDLADQSSRMKDYYDLYQILQNEKYNPKTLQEAIIHTFENRHTPYNENTMFFRKEFGSNQQMQVRWTAFMRKITSTDILSFTEVIAFLQQRLLPFWENMKDE